jgi:hypothetical protein
MSGIFTEFFRARHLALAFAAALVVLFAAPSAWANESTEQSDSEPTSYEVEPIEAASLGEGDDASFEVEEYGPDKLQEAGIVPQIRGQSVGRFADLTTEGTPEQRWAAWYFGLFFGPSLTNPTARYQPGFEGELDASRPIVLRNFVNLGYSINNEMQLTATGAWTDSPIDGQEFILRDPQLRVSHNSLVSTGGFNLYGDVRAVFPMSDASREQDIRFGLQVFTFPTWESGRWLFAVWASASTYIFGPQGSGNDLELYFGPNVSYQVSPKVSLTLLYETGAAHSFGSPAFQLVNDGSAIQPGVSWDILPTLNLSPFLNIPTTQTPTLAATSFGASIWWKAF